MRAVIGLVFLCLHLSADPVWAQPDDEPRYRLDCEAAHAYSRHLRGVALIAVYQGDVMCETYADGVSAEDAWEMASGVKSFTGVMAAAAVQDGLLDLDERVADTIVEWQDDRRRSRITIRQLLNLTSGLRVNRNARRVPSYAAAVRTQAQHEPGRRFEYGPRPFQVFGEVLRRKLAAAGLDPSPGHYFQRRVLGPIGVRLARWGAVDGMPILSENASITPMQWARFGYFVSIGGEVGGEALVDPDAIAEMFVPSDVQPIYGLSWWMPHPSRDTGGSSRRWRQIMDSLRAEDDFPQFRMSAGAGGQRLYLFPDLDLVVVRMTRGVNDDPDTRFQDWSDREFINRLLVSLEGEGE